jgi:16S rRNA (guanine527-N7)-methyltransferase
MPNDILAEGILKLCETDAGTESLVRPRFDEIAARLAAYIAEIELFNPALGLVGAGSRQELVVRHILDSLAPLGILRRLLADRAPCAADVGSGAGLPGIPLAIALPQVRFTLIERMGRRAGFLRNAQAVLGLSNIAVEEVEQEKAGPGRFSLVVFRAFRPLEPKIIKGLFRLLNDGGILAAYKGRREKIGEEMEALKFGCEWEAIPCPVPFLDEERHLLLITKT